MSNIYINNGYKDRKDYLLSLADEYGVDEQAVYELASVLGPEEDFDGLIVAIEDELLY